MHYIHSPVFGLQTLEAQWFLIVRDIIHTATVSISPSLDTTCVLVRFLLPLPLILFIASSLSLNTLSTI